ncbi:MAG: hypothetical protein AAF702_01720 [Chloroflexota bacterium]
MSFISKEHQTVINRIHPHPSVFYDLIDLGSRAEYSEEEKERRKQDTEGEIQRLEDELLKLRFISERLRLLQHEDSYLHLRSEYDASHFIATVVRLFSIVRPQDLEILLETLLEILEKNREEKLREFYDIVEPRGDDFPVQVELTKLSANALKLYYLVNGRSFDEEDLQELAEQQGIDLEEGFKELKKHNIVLEDEDRFFFYRVNKKIPNNWW